MFINKVYSFINNFKKSIEEYNRYSKNFDIEYKVEDLIYIVREYLAIDSQWTKYTFSMVHDFLDSEERRIIQKMYKKKLKMKKCIEKKQKEIESSIKL